MWIRVWDLGVGGQCVDTCLGFGSRGTVCGYVFGIWE